MFNKKHKIGDVVSKLRKEKGWTQNELAEKLQVSDKAISKWESNKGDPSIEFLPMLAELFGVTLDYLMIGKEQEEKIITMSKLELCVKKDDVDMFNNISSSTLESEDENGNTIFDYIEKYDAKNIYYELMKRLKPSSLYLKNPQKILELFLKYDDIDALDSISFFKHNLSRNPWGDIISLEKKDGIYVEENIEAMIKFLPKNNSIIIRALSLHEKEMVNNVSDWQTVYSTILYFALIYNKEEIVKQTIDTIFEINNTSIKEYETKTSTARYDEKGLYRLSIKPTNIVTGRNYSRINNYAVIALPIKTLQLLIDKKYFNEVKQFNKYNEIFKTETISTGLIDAGVMKQEGKNSNDDIYIVSCMDYGIVNIDKLLTCNNLEIVKKAFDNYPICFDEMLKMNMKHKEFKKLYMFSVDNDFKHLAQALLLINAENFGNSYVEKQINSLTQEVYNNNNKFDINRKYFVKSQQNYGLLGMNKSKARKTRQEVTDEIIKELTWKLDKESTVGGLTKEYFEDLYSKNDFELLIIKLCVKLEAILKYDYRYDGTFEEMLNKFCDRFIPMDDENYTGYDHTPSLLNKLRMKRNNIVHSEINNVELSLKEMKDCINYICKLDKEN